jgi:hypothetical protein
MNYWSAIDIVKQIAGELGLVQPDSLFGSDDVQVGQLLAYLNSAGNELSLYYPWEQFVQVWTLPTVSGIDNYDLPADWSYFVDQTQWDQTNHWPLLGPKSAQEWAWLKGGVLQAAPRMRYRVYKDKFWVHPVPGSTVFTFRMEYIRRTWCTNVKQGNVDGALVLSDGDVVQYEPWLLVKYIKLKFYELKGFDSTGVRSDFMRIFQSLTGKDRGAPVLSLASRAAPIFIGPWSIPDGSWDTTGGASP